jgi:hypothetical protein
MKVLKFSLICFFIGCLTFSCADGNIEKDPVPYSKVTKSLTIFLPEQMREHLETKGENGEPMLTKEEQDIIYKLSMLQWAYIDYDGKKATFKLSKDEVLSKGFSKSDYNNIMDSFEVINNFQLTDEELRKCFDEQFPNAKKEWQEEAEKFGLINERIKE